MSIFEDIVIYKLCIKYNARTVFSDYGTKYFGLFSQKEYLRNRIKYITYKLCSKIYNMSNFNLILIPFN